MRRKPFPSLLFCTQKWFDDVFFCLFFLFFFTSICLTLGKRFVYKFILQIHKNLSPLPASICLSYCVPYQGTAGWVRKSHHHHRAEQAPTMGTRMDHAHLVLASDHARPSRANFLQKAHSCKTGGINLERKQTLTAALAWLKHKQLFAGNRWQHLLSKGYC